MAARDDLLLTRRRLASLTVGDPPPDRPDAPDPSGSGPAPSGGPDEPRGRHAWRPPLPEPTAASEVPEPAADPGDEPAAGVRVLRPRPGRGWQERWVPAGWRGHRWDPGRGGCLALAATAAVAAVLAAVGVWRDRPVAETVPPLPVVASTAAPSATPGPTPVPTVAPAAATTPPELVVSVVGAVSAPGLVRLPPGSRVADAIAAAAGAVPGTDLLSLNLAAPVADGEQVVVGAPGPPATGAAGPPSPAAAAAGTGTSAGAAPAGGPVNLNTADVAALDTLPGVGPVTAQKIVDHRTSTGPFTSVDQLTEVPGIGDARLASLRDLVTV
ncbi:helix-hairpin-helix domain-containing protein [Rhodococcus aerolatus]